MKREGWRKGRRREGGEGRGRGRGEEGGMKREGWRKGRRREGGEGRDGGMIVSSTTYMYEAES